MNTPIAGPLAKFIVKNSKYKYLLDEGRDELLKTLKQELVDKKDLSNAEYFAIHGDGTGHFTNICEQWMLDLWKKTLDQYGFDYTKFERALQESSTIGEFFKQAPFGVGPTAVQKIDSTLDPIVKERRVKTRVKKTKVLPPQKLSEKEKDDLQESWAVQEKKKPRASLFVPAPEKAEDSAKKRGKL